MSKKRTSNRPKKHDPRATSLIINTIIIFISKAAAQLVGVFLLPLYTFSLTPAEYGLADLLMTYILLLIPLCSVQLEMATFRYLIDVRGNLEKEEHILGTSWSLLLALIGIITTVASVAIVMINIPYGWYALVAVWTGMILTFFQQAARGMGKIVDFAISGIITVISTVLISAILLLALQLKTEGVILGVIVANIFSISYLLIRLRLWRRLHIINDSSLRRQILRYALPLVPSTVSWWAIGAFGRTIITAVLGVASAGLYAVGYRFTMLFSGIPYVFNLSWTESASLAFKHEDRDAYYSRIANSSLKIFCIAAALMMLFIGLSFDWFIDLSYRQAYYVVPLLMIGLLFNAMASYYHAIFAAHKDTKFIALSSIVAALVSIIISATLVNVLDIYGVAIGAMGGYSIMATWSHMRVKHYVFISYEPSNVATGIGFLVGAVVVYYIDNWPMLLLSASFMTMSVLLLYKNEIRQFIKYVRKKLERK